MICVLLVVDEQNAHTEEQENQLAEEYRKELEESKEEEKDEDTKEYDSSSGKVMTVKNEKQSC